MLKRTMLLLIFTVAAFGQMTYNPFYGATVEPPNFPIDVIEYHACLTTYVQGVGWVGMAGQSLNAWANVAAYSGWHTHADSPRPVPSQITSSGVADYYGCVYWTFTPPKYAGWIEMEAQSVNYPNIFKTAAQRDWMPDLSLRTPSNDFATALSQFPQTFPYAYAADVWEDVRHRAPNLVSCRCCPVGCWTRGTARR